MALQVVPVPLIGPTNQGISSQVDSQRSINLLPVKIEREGEKVRWHLVGRPGLELHCEVPRTPIRGAHVIDGRHFVVAGARVYEIYANGDYREWGRINSARGKVGMASNVGKLVIGDGSQFYALTLSTGEMVALGSTPPGRYCVYFKSRILYVERDSGRVWYSNLNDVETDELQFFTAEQLPDNIIGIGTNEDQIQLFGKNSMEPWYNTGDNDLPYAPVPSGTLFSGTVSGDTVVTTDNSIWWVETTSEGQGIVRRMVGGTPARVSTSAIERFIETTSNMSAFTYQEQGHIFYVLNADEGTRVFDVKENEWHEWGWLNRNTGLMERGRAETHCFAYGYHLVTDYENGKIYRQSLDYFSDDDQEMRRSRVSAHMDFGGRAAIIDELYIDMAMGVGISSGQGSDPKVMLRYSTDGVTFSNEIEGEIGRIGEYSRQARFYRLGYGRDWVFEVSVSDPVRCVLMDARAKVRIGDR